MFEKDLNTASVHAWLGSGDDFMPWLEELEAINLSASSAHLPDVREVGDLLARLGVSSVDADEIIKAWPVPEQAVEVEWLLQRCHQQIVAQMGEPYSPSFRHWRPLPPHLAAIGRLFYIYVFLSMVPVVTQWHRERGIADHVTWATLADLGEQVAIHRRMVGTAGLKSPDWLTSHFRGVIYRLGRLQFERWRLTPRWPIYNGESDSVVSGPRPIAGAPALAVHIPESGGSLEPAVCDESFARAVDFFARHLPEQEYRFARCTSWLLDPQLADYLPPTSNIVRFQRRFHLVPGGTNDDQDIIQSVFRRVSPSLDELPQRTTLERAVVAHLRAGQHWQIRSGWLAL